MEHSTETFTENSAENNAYIKLIEEISLNA